MEKNIKISYIVSAILGIIVLIPIVGSLFKSGVNCDAAYYICIAERIAEGYTPYSGISFTYTPIWIYVMTLFKMLFFIPNGLYWPYLLLLYCIEILTAYLIYLITVNLGTKRFISYCGACLFLLTAHWLYGNAVLLEMPFLFWGLLSCLLILEWKNRPEWLMIVVGVVSSLSFLSKQYGAGFLVLDIYIILFISRKCRFSTIGYFIIGYALPIILCVAVYGTDFLQSVFSGYGTSSAVDAGYDVSIKAKVSNILYALKYYLTMICPFALVSLLFIPLAYKQKRLANMIFAYCGILGFSLQFYFSYSEHYFIPLVPFGIILMTEVFTLVNGKFLQIIKYVAVAITIMISLYKTYYNRVYKLYIKSNEIVAQQILSSKVKSVVGDDKTIFIIHCGLNYVYFLVDILPPNISTIGYSFGPLGLNEKDCASQIESADYILRFSKDYSYESFFTDSLKRVVEQYPVVGAFNNGEIFLHKVR